MPSFNHITLLGHLGAEPEDRTTPSGRAMAHLRLATNHSWRDRNDEWQEETDWHRVVVFGPAAERLRGRASKGDLVLVDGRLRMDRWTMEDGTRRTTAEVRARSVRVLGRPRLATNETVPGGGGASADDIPF